MKTITPWILMSALSLAGLVHCSSDEADDDDDGGSGRGGSAGASAGTGGSTAGKGGGAGTSGKGGGAGSAGTGGAAGDDGAAGDAGSPGTAGEGGIGGAPGQSGAGGNDAGAAGDQAVGGAGAGNVEGGAGGEGGAAAAPLTDARILHVVITINTGEVAEAQLALTRATAPAVVSFAEEMATEHGTAITEANTIATEQAITPEENPTSVALAAHSAESLAELTAVAAAEFDVAYMQAQVAAHGELLTLIDEELIPLADNAALLAFLADLRAEVNAHLVDAEVTLDSLTE